MATNQDVLNQLKLVIMQQIEMCDGKSMPFVCNMAKTEKGLNTIVEYVTNLVAQGDYEIGEALFEKERELNPNLIKD